MKYLAAVISLLFISLSLQAGERVTLYAVLQEKTPVKLSTGAEWVMEKGDSFPIVAYKESRTKVILRLAGAQFMIDAKLAREVKESELSAAMENYRKNVNTFIQTAPDKWRAEAEAQKEKAGEALGKDEKKTE